MNYNALHDETIRLLLSRLDDLCDRGARGEAAVSAYLTPVRPSTPASTCPPASARERRFCGEATPRPSGYGQ